ncbi:MAG TPA: hypothetical protein PLE48_07530 [Thiobacillus sp.]|nr:hypothetical protein [Thiobacillus sp.]HQT70259.1 hypothetical protein [Thiobacillus sp.]
MTTRLDTALAHWPYVAPLLTPPASDADYPQLAESHDAVLDAGGADETHPLAGLAAAMGNLISGYEARRQPMPVARNAAEALACLMKQHGLR